MPYQNGQGLAYFSTVGPEDEHAVQFGAGWIRDVIAYLKDPTAGPSTANQLPLGFIICVNSNMTTTTQVNALMGYGQWTQISARVLIGQGQDGDFNMTFGDKAGAETVDAEHNHQWHATSGGGGTNHDIDTIAAGTGSTASYNSAGAAQKISESADGIDRAQYTDKALSTELSIMQPYQVVSMWQRTG
jgi:hypothetical protein